MIYWSISDTYRMDGQCEKSNFGEGNSQRAVMHIYEKFFTSNVGMYFWFTNFYFFGELYFDISKSQAKSNCAFFNISLLISVVLIDIFTYYFTFTYCYYYYYFLFNLLFTFLFVHLLIYVFLTSANTFLSIFLKFFFLFLFLYFLYFFPAFYSFPFFYSSNIYSLTSTILFFLFFLISFVPLLFLNNLSSLFIFSCKQ